MGKKFTDHYVYVSQQMLCCTLHTGLLENDFHFLSPGRSTLIRRGDGAAFHTHMFSTIFNVVSGGCLHTGPLSPVQYWRSECCRRLEKVDDCRLLDLAHNCHQGLPFSHPDGNRCPLRETARRRICVRFATTIPSLAARSQGETLLGLGRFRPTG